MSYDLACDLMGHMCCMVSRIDLFRYVQAKGAWGMRLGNRSEGVRHTRSQGHGTRRRSRRVGWVGLAAVLGLAAAGCGSSASSTTPPTTSGSNTIPAGLSTSSFSVDIASTMSKLKKLTAFATKGASSLQVGVILPDTTSSTRYVNFDQPYLNDAFADAGYTQAQYRIDNAQGSDATELNDATADINLGAKVLIMDPLDGPTGVAIAKLAQSKGGTIFQQAFTANPKINATIEANDGLANAVITDLKAAGVKANKVPTTGQDATAQGMAWILEGYQCGSVYKAVYKEAQDAVAMATILLAGDTPPAALLNGSTVDPADSTITEPASLLTPVWVTKANMEKTVVKDGFDPASAICAIAGASVCTAAGIS